MLSSFLRGLRKWGIGAGMLLFGWAQESVSTSSEYDIQRQVLSDSCGILTEGMWSWVKIEILSDNRQLVYEEGCVVVPREGPYEISRFLPPVFEEAKIEVEGVEAWEIRDDGERVPLPCEVNPLGVHTEPPSWIIGCAFEGESQKRRFQIVYRVRGLLRDKGNRREVLWWPRGERGVTILFPFDIKGYTGIVEGMGEAPGSFMLHGCREITWKSDTTANGTLRVRFREEVRSQRLGVLSALVMVIAVVIFLWAWVLNVPVYGGGEEVIILEGELPAKDPPAWVHAFVAKGLPTPLGFLAAVLDLARRGYVSLIAQGEGLGVKLQKPPDESLHPHEQHLLNSLAKFEEEGRELKGAESSPLVLIPDCFEDERCIPFLVEFNRLLEKEIEIAGSIAPSLWRKRLGFFLCCAGSLALIFLFVKIRNLPFIQTSLEREGSGVYVPLLFFTIVPALTLISSVYMYKSLVAVRMMLIICNLIYLMLSLLWVLDVALNDTWNLPDTWNEFWYSYVPLHVSFSLFFLSAYFILYSFRYTELGKERAKRWRRFEEWLIELPLSPQELAKHVETYLPYAIALGVPKPLFTYVRRELGGLPAPAWLEVLPPSKDSLQTKKNPIQYSVTMRHAMEIIDMTVDNIFSKVYRVEKNKDGSTTTTIDLTALLPFNPASLLHFYYKSQASLSKRQSGYSFYYSRAYGMMVVGSLLIGISLFQLMQSWETVWWEEIINKGAFLLVGLLCGVAGATLWMWARREKQAAKPAKKLRSLWKFLKDQGKVKIEEIAAHLGISKAEVPKWIYKLGAAEAFTGYVDWKDGVLYSVEAGLLGEGKGCPQCGGRLEPAGKGIFKCQYCGAEVFLKKPAPSG
jgi:hypothetical protein